MLLDQIKKANDIKYIDPELYGDLAEEIRDFLIQKIIYINRFLYIYRQKPENFQSYYIVIYSGAEKAPETDNIGILSNENISHITFPAAHKCRRLCFVFTGYSTYPTVQSVLIDQDRY